LRYLVDRTERFFALVRDEATARFVLLDVARAVVDFFDFVVDAAVFLAVFERDVLFLLCAANPMVAATQARHRSAMRIRFIRPSHLPSRHHIDRSPPVSTGREPCKTPLFCCIGRCHVKL
jgi:hypothetical protein